MQVRDDNEGVLKRMLARVIPFLLPADALGGSCAFNCLFSSLTSMLIVATEVVTMTQI